MELKRECAEYLRGGKGKRLRRKHSEEQQ